MLADVVTTPPTQQESVLTLAQPSQVSVVKVKANSDLKNFCIQMITPEITAVQNLLQLTFQATMPQVKIGGYEDENAGFVLCDTLVQTKLEKALFGILFQPQIFGVRPEIVAQDVFPKIFSTSGFEGELITVPDWQNPTPGVMMLYYEFILLSFYTAFQGYVQTKKYTIHTKLIEPNTKMALQCLAASLVPNLQLIVHADSQEKVEPLTTFFKANQGKTVQEVLSSLKQ